MFCTQCGNQLPDDSRFCPRCGAPVGAPTSAVNQAVSATPQTPPAPAAPAAAPAASPTPAAAPAPTPAASFAAPAPAAPATMPAPAPATAPAASPQAPASDSLSMLSAFVQAMSNRLGEPAQYIPELGAYLIVTKRFSAALANMHQHFFVSAYDAAGYPEMQAYMKACSDWALNNYQGALRGLQKGVVSYAILLQHPLNANAVAFTKELPKKHFAAFDLPILVDPFTGACEMLEKTPVWGFAMWKGIKKAAREALGF